MITESIIVAIRNVLAQHGVPDAVVALSVPEDAAHGDYASSAALSYAKAAHLSPKELAEHIAEAVRSVDGVAQVSVAGPGYVNMTVTPAVLMNTIQTIRTMRDTWGHADAPRHERWLIEHTSPNPNKAMHIGHLRNNLTGMAIANIASFSGIEVIRDCVDNNRGIAIAKLMWGFLKFARKDGDTTKTDISYWYAHQDEWCTPDASGQRPDRFVDALYVKGAGDFSDDTIPTIRKMVIDWEAGDVQVRALWALVLTYSYEGQKLTLKRLGNVWDYVWHESDHYADGKHWVEEGLKKGIFKEGDGGAIVTDFSAYGIPDTVVIKSDGTSLYITQDLELTRLKREKFHPDRMFWVIGPEQSLAMKQMFAACEQLGIGKQSDYTHVSYGAVTIKGEGKMSSRAGNVLYIDDLIDAVKERVRAIMKESTLTDGEKDAIAESVALGAVKYGFLKAGRERDIAFDVETATDLHGDSGPYIQYAHARARSVIAAAAASGITAQNAEPHTDGERLIARILIQFPDVVARAHAEFAPHHIAQYAHTLAAAYNAWYAQERVVGDPRAAARAALTEAVAITLKNALTLLGIDAPDRM